MNMVARVGAAFAGMALTVALTGCTNNGTSNAGQNPSSSGASAAPSSGGAGNPSQATASPSGQASAPVPQRTRCTAGDLRLSLGGGDAAAGTVYRTLRFTNVSGRSCTLRGYPGVSYVAGDDGHQVGGPAARTPEGGTPIRLGSGQTASAVVGLVNVHNYEAATCRPQPVRGLRVYPPDETRSTFVALRNTGCANPAVNQLTVSALQPGRGE
jgi:hypothetical protein